MFSSNTTQVSDGGYQISRSLRFNSADSAYLNRTPATTTNQKTWTFSAWIKRSKLSTNQRIFQAREATTGNQFFLRFSSDNTILITGSSGAFELQTTQLFRDPSAWYHIVFACDTTQATSSNRFKLYINGSQVIAFGTATYPSQNLDTTINSAFPHGLGAENSGPSEFYDGYMTEVNLIDGTQLTPSSFGETNAQTGVWQPKAYSGSYGTNGFYLNFSDNSNTTAATLGKDYSGNGNNWTPNNFSVTAGAGNDSMVDVPTPYGVDTGVGGTVRGNYSTLNPLNTAYTDKTFSNGNLNVTGSTTNQVGGHSTMQIPTTGQWYAECVMTAFGSGSPFIGVNGGTTTLGAGGASYRADGTKELNGTGSSYGATWTTNDVIGIAVDTGAGSITFYKNGTSQGVAYTTLNTNFTNGLFFSCQGAAGTTTFVYNFGQRPFAYTAPSGFKALCTQNLPTPTIGATSTTLAGKYFNPVLYTGNSGVNVVTGMGFQPDMLWQKDRTSTGNNVIDDAVRGINNVLITNSTLAELTGTTYLTSFDSDGFSMNTASPAFNFSGRSYVAWGWKANGSGSTNTAGSITSTVSANTTSGFSVVTYTGTGSNATVGHGLGVAPSMVIVKGRNTVSNWVVWHSTFSGDGYTLLNSTGGQSTGATIWNSTVPTSTVFSVGTNLSVNESGDPKVAYVFAPVAGYSKFGSYTGNGNTNRNFVYLGFTPAVIMVKRTSSAGTNWRIVNPRRVYLSPNTSDAEYASYPGPFLQTANGFEISGGDDVNENGGTFIYAAFASVPFKFSLAQ